METAEAIESLRALRTVRRFTDQPVPQAVLDEAFPPTEAKCPTETRPQAAPARDG